MRIKIVITSLLCSLALALVAQTTDLPRKTLNGKEYYVYKVSKGEGFYNITKKFDISQEDIIKYNPSAKSGLKRGQVLFIPVDKNATSEAGSRTEPFEHTIKRGESLYAISKMYGVSIDEIIALNPGSRKRINAGDKLLIPQKGGSNSAVAEKKSTATKSASSNGSKPTSENQSYVYHTITAGETLYAIARQYDSDVESIMRANPGIKPSKLARGSVIRVPSQEVAAPVVESNDKTTATVIPQEEVKEEEVKPVVPEKIYQTYVAKKKETYYSIAQKFGVTIADLRAVNPEIRVVSEGMIINLPEKVKEQQAEKEPATASQENSTEYLEELYNRIYTKKDADHINVAVMLPFMLKEENNLKSELYTEYYQGFLLAVDSLKRKGYSINLSAYDTEGSADVVRSILQKPQMTTMDLIIAPDQEEAIDLIADFGERYDINVVNTFSMKNEKINTNARVFQTNIPGSYLYAETVAQFVKTFKNRDVILLNDNSEEGKSNEFIELLKDELGARNLTYSVCDYNGTLKPDNLAAIGKSASVVFVPTSNKKEVLSQILPALSNYVTNNPQMQVSLFGYPNWVPQINRNLDELYQLDTYIFTRFYTTPNDARMYDLSLKYLYWYNQEMKNASPKYALLGFDTGMYFMSAIAESGKNFANYDMKGDSNSIQTDFRFERINNWSGFINKSFYFVHLSPEMKIEKISK